MSGGVAETPPDAVPVHDAATVVLLRDGTDGLEAWLLQRVTSMAFAAGMTVFPGGRVETTDADLPIPGAAVALAARTFDCAATMARALIGAAVRETYEETGVLLTTPSPDLAEARADVEAGRRPFADLLHEHALTVEAAALAPWGHWVTPVGESRRYDTRFFIAALPAGAHARDVTSESAEASWVAVAEALEQVRAGSRGMLPPTVITLESLAPFGTVAEVMAAAPDRPIDTIEPRLRWSDEGGRYVELPDGRTMKFLLPPRQ
jgi:8-oxo-dGTP pyrophosphatase MutT (NUDIX family)